MPASLVRVPGFAIAFVAALSLLALPASAAATNFEVTTIGVGLDQTADNEICQTAVVGECTLRAAIEESNSDEDRDTISFKSNPFDGQGADVIPTTGLPAITEAVGINGDLTGVGCNTAAEVAGPCVEISGTTGLVVDDVDDVSIRGLAITGALTAINVIDSSEELVLLDNWIGVKLTGANGANTTGVFLDPDSDEATIGDYSGTGLTLGNVFANNTGVALDIAGADDTIVEGNLFGVGPEGTTPAPNVSNLEVTGQDSVPDDFTAEGTQIGADVGNADPEAVESEFCDGGCNVFAPVLGGFEGSIDLRPDAVETIEIPAEDVVVEGNFIGLGATGNPLSSSAEVGVLVAGPGGSIGPKEVRIGGGEPGEANHINKATYGVFASNAPDLLVANGLYGLDTSGTAVSGANSTSVYVFSDETLLPGTNALVTENTIASGESGIGVEIQGVGATVVENTIGLGSGGEELGAGGIGIYARGNTGGSLIEGNTIFGASQVGILAKNPLNSIIANTIEASAEAGVRVDAPAFVSVFGTEIGGDEAGSENVISGTNGPAIELIEAPPGEVSETVIRRNLGSANDDVFIDLGGNGKGTAPGQPNEGIRAPSIDAVTATSASGTSEAFARVRLFRKATPAFGEIQSFLGASTADGSGNWTISFPQQAGQTNIAATQTGASGTSELEFAITPPDPPKEEPPACVDGPGCPGGPFTAAPDTKIAKKPKLKGKPTAKFKFSSTAAGSTFECKLDKGKFKKCRSPKTYKKLKPGKHVFKVRAVSPAGVKDSTPATKKFKVKG